jgi:hypothetical protein
MSIHGEEWSAAHDALNRMRRASVRRSGCHLTAEMIASLAGTIIGQMWLEDDPRKSNTKGGAA